SIHSLSVHRSPSHRAIHLFPTRRSSDLLGLHDTGDDEFRQWGTVQGGGQQHGGNGDECDGDADGGRSSGSTDDHHAANEPDGDGDRKSTRLNSSHEWISYAVFCLKKKRR